MNIPDKYRDRYDSLAQEHPWMREMQDGTNGDDGETNGIEDEITLPEGDAPSEFAEILMRLAADCSCMGDGIVRHFEPKDVQDDVDELMRVVERNYVSREVFEDLRDEFVWETTFLHRMGKKCGTNDVPSLVAYVDKLEAETIEYDKALDAVKNERDELKRKLEIADRHEFESDQACDECKEHTDELLVELTAERDEALEIRDKAIGDAATFKAERDELKAQQESEFTMCIDCRQQARAEYDQLKAERDEWKAKYLGAVNDAEDYKTLWQRSRECSSKVRAGSSKSAKRAAAVDRLRLNPMGKSLAEIVTGLSHTDSWDDKRNALLDLLTDDESCRQYADQGERDKTPDYESDSREKLEADVRERMEIFERNGTLVFADDVFEWLDRQAAIEKRRCFDGIAEHQAENLKLQGRIRELEAERERNRRQIDHLTAQCYGMDGLTATAKIRELQRRLDSRGGKEVM